MRLKKKRNIVICLTAVIVLTLLLAACEDVSAVSKEGGSSGQGDAALALAVERGTDSGQADEGGAESPAEADRQEQDAGEPAAEGSAETAVNEADAVEQGADSESEPEAGRDAIVENTGSGEQETASEGAKAAQVTSSGQQNSSESAGSSAAAAGNSKVTSGAAQGTSSGQQNSSKEAGGSAAAAGNSKVTSGTGQRAASGSTQEKKPKIVTQPAAITRNPKNADVRAGETAVFTVAAKGEGLSYRWEKKEPSEDVWKKSEADGKRTNKLTVKDIKADWHGMSYRCKVTDSSGNSVYSKAARLYVLSVTKHPSSQYVKEGRTAVFSVRAKGAGVVYQWELKTPSEEEWKRIGSQGSDKTKLTIEDVKPWWSRYMYRCRITDAAGKVTYTKAAWLCVLSIEKNPSTQYIKEGSTAVFRTSATGVGLNFQWQVRDDDYSDWRYSTGIGNNTNTLRINGSTAYSGFRYRCMVTDGGGNVTYTKSAGLYVLGITRNPSDRSANADATVSFSVNVTGGGISWQWQYKKPSGGDWKNTSLSGNKTKILKFKAKTSLNGYRFRCRVRDKKGHTVYSRSAKLTVRTITQNPSTRKIKVGGTAAFHVKASGSGLRYYWQARKPSEDEWFNTTAKGYRTNTLHMNGLTKYNGYKFRCKVVYPGGKAVYSKSATLYVLGITKNPSDRTSVPGKSVSFSVKAVGADVRYQWQYKNGSGDWKYYTGSGNKKSTMNVTPKASMDGTRFRCRVKDNAGNVVYSQSAELSVFY